MTCFAIPRFHPSALGQWHYLLLSLNPSLPSCRSSVIEFSPLSMSPTVFSIVSNLPFICSSTSSFFNFSCMLSKMTSTACVCCGVLSSSLLKLASCSLFVRHDEKEKQRSSNLFEAYLANFMKLIWCNGKAASERRKNTTTPFPVIYRIYTKCRCREVLARSPVKIGLLENLRYWYSSLTGLN